MENQHRQIVGERELDAADITAVNKVTTLGKVVEKFLEELGHDNPVDLRLLAIAKTHLQTGFMFATRAVKQPTSF